MFHGYKPYRQQQVQSSKWSAYQTSAQYRTGYDNVESNFGFGRPGVGYWTEDTRHHEPDEFHPYEPPKPFDPDGPPSPVNPVGPNKPDRHHTYIELPYGLPPPMGVPVGGYTSRLGICSQKTRSSGWKEYLKSGMKGYLQEGCETQ